MRSSISVRLNRKGQCVIPKSIRDALGLKEGDGLVVTLEGQRVVVMQAQEHARASRGLLKGTWGGGRKTTGRYLQRERRSWR